MFGVAPQPQRKVILLQQCTPHFLDTMLGDCYVGGAQTVAQLLTRAAPGLGSMRPLTKRRGSAS